MKIVPAESLPPQLPRPQLSTMVEILDFASTIETSYCTASPAGCGPKPLAERDYVHKGASGRTTDHTNTLKCHICFLTTV